MAFSSPPRDVSLLEALKSFLETLSLQQRPDIENCTPWDGMVSVCRNPQLRKEFVRTLSLSQGNSLRLLLLWKSQILSLPTSVSLWFCRRGLSTDDAFDGLFHFEMEQGSYGSDHTARMLFNVRKLAAELYSYRRLLKSYLSASLKIEWWPGDAASSEYVFLEQSIREDMGGRALSSSVGSSTRVQGEEHLGAPLYLWDTWKGRTMETKCLSEKLPRYAAISHTWGRWKLEPSVDMRPMVPWLVPQNSLFSVRDLPDGLKKMATKLSLRYIWIDLFCIPQNGSEEASREISRQAEIFGGARTAVAWLSTMRSWKVLSQTVSWMLLKPLVPDKRRTISIKLRVFLLFFNLLSSRGKKDIGTFKHFFDTGERIRRRLHRLDKRLRWRYMPNFDYHTDTVEHGCEGKLNAASLGFLPFHWFSSLWTLQESTLRPDMLFANRGWELFEVANEAPVALDTLTQLCCSWESEIEPPTPVKWVGGIICRSGIQLNYFENPLQALAMGATRCCTSRRSEAIMSVLGCVEWHRNVVRDRQSSTRPSSDPNNSHLLLGLYEYDFILEVLQRHRSSFFSSRSWSYSFFFEVLEKKQPLGTILPFTDLSQYRPAWLTVKHVPFYECGYCLPHPSVNTWELLRDGSVKMSKAGILYRTPDVNRRGTWGSLFSDRYTIWGPTEHRVNESNMVQSRMPLGEWMNTRWTNLSKYAVAVSWANSPCKIIAGFVLAEVEIDGRSSAKHLAKLADFECIVRVTLPLIPPVTEVDWIVY